mmetsp:Transcript_13427/g.57243  ORF Transcript_13427/g.57243 Transcript_13427/m.57243 type:complete len:229 (-) Transcript_13427:72-758(-)
MRRRGAPVRASAAQSELGRARTVRRVSSVERRDAFRAGRELYGRGARGRDAGPVPRKRRADVRGRADGGDRGSRRARRRLAIAIRAEARRARPRDRRGVRREARPGDGGVRAPLFAVGRDETNGNGNGNRERRFVRVFGKRFQREDGPRTRGPTGFFARVSRDARRVPRSPGAGRGRRGARRSAAATKKRERRSETQKKGFVRDAAVPGVLAAVRVPRRRRVFAGALG